MSMHLYTYVGPMIKVKKVEGFNASNFCYETCKEALCTFQTNEIEKSDYQLLLPNLRSLQTDLTQIINEFYDISPIILNPDIQSECDKFSNNTEEIRKLIPVPYEVVWGVFSYWL